MHSSISRYNNTNHSYSNSNKVVYKSNYFVIFTFLFLLLVPYEVESIKGCTVALINANTNKRKVLCGNPLEKINFIPKDLPPTTHIISITGQNISDINKDDFVSVSELTTLSIKYSNLRYIHRTAFRSLSQLTNLDLSGNLLTISDFSLPKEVFKNLINLKILIITENPLKIIPDYIFRPMSLSLEKIVITHCKSPPLKISAKTFNSLFNLKILDLRWNNLETLDKETEFDFRSMKLRALFLSNNPWHCDCRIRWLYFYLMEIQHSVTLFESNKETPRCSQPNNLLNNKFPTVPDSRYKLTVNDFVCLSKCAALKPVKYYDYGETVNLTCNCFSDPIQKVTWRKDGKVLSVSNYKKVQIQTVGKEQFNSTITIKSLDFSDTGNWSCEINLSIKSKELLINYFHVALYSNHSSTNSASVNMYIFVGLGSSLLLISLIVVMFFMFCNRETLCQYHNQHPMVICGYHESHQLRKSSPDINNEIDGDVRFQYNQSDGRFTTSFYENTIPLNSTLTNAMQKYQHSNNMSFSANKNIILKNSSNSNINKNADVENNPIIKIPSSDKMLNVYCGCHTYSVFNSDNDDTDTNTTVGLASIKKINQDDQYQTISSRDFEKLFPKIKQCPFHGSSATLTRVPSKKPCPVHSSTATLPSRLSSKRSNIEHRYGCPKHNTDNISLKSLKFDDSFDCSSMQRSKSVSKIVEKAARPLEDRRATMGSMSYKPCPLHGNILAALTEGVIDPTRNDVDDDDDSGGGGGGIGGHRGTRFSSSRKSSVNRSQNPIGILTNSSSHSKRAVGQHHQANDDASSPINPVNTNHSTIPRKFNGCDTVNPSYVDFHSTNLRNNIINSGSQHNVVSSNRRTAGEKLKTTFKAQPTLDNASIVPLVSKSAINSNTTNINNNNLISPVQSSLSSSPVLASDVHGTLV